MKEPMDDFLKHIKSTLQQHEEAYDEGAWERFTARQEQAAPQKVKRIIPMWKWAATAAAVAAGIFLVASLFNSTNKVITDEGKGTVKQTVHGDNTTVIPDNNITDKANSQNEEITAAPATPINNNNNQYIIKEEITITDFNPFISDRYNSNKQSAYAYNGNALITNKQLITPLAMPQKLSQFVLVPQQAFAQPHNNIVSNNNPIQPQHEKNIIERDDKNLIAFVPQVIEKQSSGERIRRWQPSLFISPLFGEQGMEMGYGASLGYAINDKIKITSGIAHAKISASRSYDVSSPIGAASSNPVAASGGTALRSAYNLANMQETSTLQHVNGYLSGVDVPVEINYSISKKLYATAGVSGLFVLDDNKQFTYIDSRNVKVSVETNEGALKEDKSVTFNDKSTSQTPIQAPNESTTFLGFYNLSMGFKQKISNKNAVSLEPFVKIPVKHVTQQNLNYMGTGIRLKFDF